MILGHFAVACIAKQTYFRSQNIIFLAVAAILSDLLDKPPSILFGWYGRGLGHTLVVFAGITILAWLFLPRLGLKPDLVIAGLVMWSTHLVGDLVEWHVLFWPFVAWIPEPRTPFDFWEKIYGFYVLRSPPGQFWLEIFCITTTLILFSVQMLIPRLAGTVSSPNSFNRGRRQ